MITIILKIHPLLIFGVIYNYLNTYKKKGFIHLSHLSPILLGFTQNTIIIIIFRNLQ
jgi:hypothetical protein